MEKNINIILEAIKLWTSFFGNQNHMFLI